MQRVLSFTPEDSGRFKMLSTGFTVGAMHERHKNQQQGQSREDRKSETRIKRALAGVSDPPEGENAGEVDVRPRTMKAAGGDVKLDQQDYTRLVRYVGLTPWTVHEVEQASELEDWLDAAPQVKDE